MQVQLTEEQVAQLRKIAKDGDRSISDVVREGVDELNHEEASSVHAGADRGSTAVCRRRIFRPGRIKYCART